MHAKVLVFDPIAATRIKLKAKLTTAHYQVLLVTDPNDVLPKSQDEAPDLIVLAQDPGPPRVADRPNDAGPRAPCALDLCKKLKSNRGSKPIPVLLLCSTDCTEARIAALQAQADDVLSPPFDDALLVARLRSLLRMRVAQDELRLRDGTAQALGFADRQEVFETRGSALLITHTEPASKAWAQRLTPDPQVALRTTTLDQAAQVFGGEHAPDVLVLGLESAKPEPFFQLLADLRARPHTRHAGVIVQLDRQSGGAAAHALDLGANDVMPCRFDPAEMAARIRLQINRKRMDDRLRNIMWDGLNAAVIDPLTGLYNRRYALSHLTRVTEQAVTQGHPFCVMVADLDFFKQINDSLGHAAGDSVLTKVASRLRQNLRAVDLVARIGGEEFLIVLPNTAPNAAHSVALRLCNVISEKPIALEDNGPPRQAETRDPESVRVTLSIGVATFDPKTERLEDTPRTESVPNQVERMMRRADAALYKAKCTGRDRVYLARRTPICKSQSTPEKRRALL